MATNYGQTTSYAGFWARVAAYFIDFSILIVFAVAISVASTYVGDMGKIIGNIVFILISLLYWPVMESSARQATFGKSIVGIQVTDLDGNRVSFIRAFLRNLAKIISAIPLDIGFLLAAFTGRKQALHDMITKTLVVRTAPSSFIKTLATTVGALVISVGGCGAFFYYMVLPKMQNENGGAMQGAAKPAIIPLPAPAQSPSPVPKGLPPIPATASKPQIIPPAAPVASAPNVAAASPQPAPAMQQPVPPAPQPAVIPAAAEPAKEPGPKSLKSASGSQKSSPGEQKSASKPPKAETISEPMDSASAAPEQLREISRRSTALPEPAPTSMFAPDTESRVIKPKYNDVMTAVLRGDKDGVKQLLDLGWWVDKPGSDGVTPLMAAVMNRDAQMVQLLLDNGAVPSSQALNLARKNKDSETASVLEQRGAR